VKFAFLCVANSARSQMAEGLARATAPEGFEISSAGSKPATVNSFAIQVMAEIGIDIRSHSSKGLEAVPLAEATAIITLCAEEECPLTPPGVERRSWAMPDPARPTETGEEALQAFRVARDEIKAKVQDLWEEFG
jgi:arsenate reductase